MCDGWELLSHLIAWPGGAVYHFPKGVCRHLGLGIFSIWEALSNNGMKEKPHVYNFMKGYPFHVRPSSLSHLHVAVAESPNFYFLLSDLQMRPIALPTRIPTHIPCIFLGVILFFFFFNLWYHKLSSYTFPCRNQSSPIWPFQWVITPDTSENMINGSAGYILPTGLGTFSVSIGENVQRTDDLQSLLDSSLHFPFVSCMWVRGKCCQAGFVPSQCVLLLHFRVWDAWHTWLFSCFPSDWNNFQLFL